jgi:signal peptidase I
MQQLKTIPQNNYYSQNEMPEMPTPEEVEPIVGGKHKKGSDGWRSIASTLFIIIATPIMALLLISFVFQSYEVDGPSMETTLQNADRLIVWKAPHTWAKITGKDYIPRRADIVIFHKGGSINSQYETGDRQLIKRVIGLPGDRIVVKEGKVTVFNDENTKGFNPDQASNNPSKLIENTECFGDFCDYTVNEGEVYVMGDNRGNSLDSRAFGAVKSDELVGKLSFRIYPFNKFQHF